MTHCRTEKGKLRTWTKFLGKRENAICRYCGKAEETGHYLVFQCRKSGRPVRPIIQQVAQRNKELKEMEERGERDADELPMGWNQWFEQWKGLEKKLEKWEDGAVLTYWKDWHDLESGDWFSLEGKDLAEEFFSNLFKKREDEEEEPIIP